MMNNATETKAAAVAAMAPGLKAVATRIVNAQERFIAFAIETAGLSRDEAALALAVLSKGGKKAPLKIDPVVGSFHFSHGAFAEPVVLQRAAGRDV